MKKIYFVFCFICLCTIPVLAQTTHDIPVIKDKSFQSSSIPVFRIFPNPFPGGTTIEYELSVSSQVEIKIFNILGQKLNTLIDEFQQPGTKSVQWDGTGNDGVVLETGVYYAILTAGDEKAVIKILKTH